MECNPYFAPFKVMAKDTHQRWKKADFAFADFLFFGRCFPVAILYDLKGCLTDGGIYGKYC